jgi:hypothetical protein
MKKAFDTQLYKDLDTLMLKKHENSFETENIDKNPIIR